MSKAVINPEAVASLNDAIANLGSTVTTPSNGSYATVTSGGYIKIGKLVMVDVIVTCTTTVASTNASLVTGMPSAALTSSPLGIAVDATTQANTTCRIEGGTIYSGINITSGTTYKITGCYISAS